MWLYYFYYVLLLIVAVAGLAVSALGLPGLWLMVAATALFSLATGGVVLTWKTVVGIALLALASEIVEFLAGAAGSKTAGGTWRGIVGAAVGGVVGGLVGVPVPIVGPVIGAILGAAIGAGAFELAGDSRDIRKAGNVAVGAAKGRFVGTLSKLTFGSVMLLLTIVYALPVGTDLPPAEDSPPVLEDGQTPADQSIGE